MRIRGIKIIILTVSQKAKKGFLRIHQFYKGEFMKTKPDITRDVRGFMKSRVILTAAELDFFSKLDGNFISAEDLADMLGLDKKATTRILDCLVTFDLLEKEKSRYHTTEKGSYLSSKNPESVLPMVNHMNAIWGNWSRLTEIAKNGTHPNIRPVVDSDAKKDRHAFIGAMHVAARRISKKIAAAYDLSPFKTLLDVGGGSGAYTIAFLKKNRQLKAVIFDLENVIPMTKEKIAENGLQHRVRFIPGNFYEDDLPAGCDLALLSAIIHQNSPQQNLSLYRKIYHALDPGGRLIIRDHIMDESRTNPSAGALFALNMLVNTPAGDTYTFKEVKDTLKEAGFIEIRLALSGKEMDCLVEALKPKQT
jgi:ubiquinone/menaquinone biosynthesis C-methylase UbiE/predicted transcriptional regulator